jgi:hypothetical protein
MLFTKKDKNKYVLTKKLSMKVGKDTLEMTIKPLPINFQDLLNDELPYPAKKKVFNKSTKSWGYKETPDYDEKKKKIDALRTYALFVMGTVEEIEGDTLNDKIETLIDTGLPIGYFIEVVNEIQALSGITDSEFQTNP